VPTVAGQDGDELGRRLAAVPGVLGDPDPEPEPDPEPDPGPASDQD
jgi:hypothetical protein